MKAYQLPSPLAAIVDWTLVGPMGPTLPESFYARPVLAIDGGGHYASRMDVWVGDKDSFSEDTPTEHAFLHPPQKDCSDLALGLRLFTQAHQLRLHLWGFLGGRKDHELFNIGECLAFLDTKPESQILFYDDTGKISFHLISEGHWRFRHEGPFSLGCVKPTMVKLKGDCAYPIPSSRGLLPLSSFGLSNEARGDLHLETKGSLFLYFPEGK